MTTAQVKIGPELARWIVGFDTLPAQILIAAQAQWDEATERFYQRTQQYAHILTGANISSGEFEVHTDGMTVVGTVSYGEHAIFEELRGGDHALITRGWEATSDVFAEALPAAFAAVAASWR